MDRVNFIGSIDGIQYPEMLINFFDHFVALKQIIEDNGKVSVNSCSNNKIVFGITFNNSDIQKTALGILQSLQGFVVIYDRKIHVSIEALTDLDVIMSLE